MLSTLGSIIQKKPWLVVTLVIIVTIGFSIFIPGLQFKTNFENFAPDNELVKANNRISDYFGMSKQVLLAFVEKQQEDSTITPQALRDQYKIQKEIEKLPGVNSTVAITTFVDTVCQMEFYKSLENCTDNQIEIALNDLLNESTQLETNILNTADPNEPVDYNIHPHISKGKSADSTDIKNYYISKDNDTITFSIEVYDLSYFKSTNKPPLSRVSTMEWYIEFENLLTPPEYSMKYQIAARIQPATSVWEIGSGLSGNIKHIIQSIRNHTLSPSYKNDVYLWIEPPGQEMFFPIAIDTANITFDFNNNRINIIVPKDELGKFGIAPHYSSFELPAKLSNFTAGIRYYQTPLLNRPGGRIVINTSYLFDRIERLQQRPILGAFVSRMLQKYDINVDDFSGMTEMLPDTFSLKDLEQTWTYTDNAPDSGVSTTIFPMIPQLFNDLRVNALSFISKDYEQTKTPKASIIIIQLDSTSDESTNNNIINEIKEFDTKFESISVQVTGESIISTQMEEASMDSMTIIGPSIFIMILCVLFLAFRRPSYMFLPIIVFAFSCIWLFGSMALLGFSFNIIFVALLPLNIGLGVEYAVNLLYNYRTELSKGRTAAEAIRLSIKEVGVAIFLAWFTTAIAFLSFLTASIPPIQTFGIFLALGITYTFIISMTFLPALRYIVDRKKKEIKVKQKKQIFSGQNVMGHLAQILIRHEKKVFVVTILICIIMGTGISQLKSEFDMNKFMPQDNPAITILSKINEDFPFSSQDQEYILLEGNVATVQTLQGLTTTHKNINDDQYVTRKTDGSTKTESIHTIIQQAVANNQSLITAYNIDESTNLPKSDEDVYELYDYLYDSADYRMQVQGILYKDQDKYTATIIRVNTGAGSESGDLTKQLKVLNEELEDDLTSYGDVSVIVTGNMLITLTIMENLVESQISSTIMCFILAFIMLSLIYRNPILGLIAMIPVTVSILWVLGTMYFIGYSLNVLTIMVTCITIGVGIDYACYIVERFRFTADQTGNVTTAVSEAISRTGSAIFIAALSSIFGFGVLVLAPIPPLQQFGIITALTLIYALITSIVVLPLMLARWAHWRKKRKGYIIHPGPPKKLDGVTEDREYSGEQ
ncbi:MAG: efflux RND transporter permease subunit [Euryarchaeota archaeon]|nr:efflux RND transporter permease subunit [Euryarchaeota archaeon]